MSIGFTLGDLMDFLFEEGLIEGKEQSLDLEIWGFSPISDSKEGTISWTRDINIDWRMISSSVVVSPINADPRSPSDKVLIRVENPRGTFIRIMQRLGAMPA